MGYAVYQDPNYRWRWAGYGVPAECDRPDCHTKIDRGLAYKCEEHVWYEQPDDDDDIQHIDEGCGLYFCSTHESHLLTPHDTVQPKPDSDEWVRHMLTDESWQQWREENPARLQAMLDRVDAA